jgi:hypothetical protein
LQSLSLLQENPLVSLYYLAAICKTGQYVQYGYGLELLESLKENAYITLQYYDTIFAQLKFQWLRSLQMGSLYSDIIASERQTLELYRKGPKEFWRISQSGTGNLGGFLSIFLGAAFARQMSITHPVVMVPVHHVDDISKANIATGEIHSSLSFINYRNSFTLSEFMQSYDPSLINGQSLNDALVLAQLMPNPFNNMDVFDRTYTFPA